MGKHWKSWLLWGGLSAALAGILAAGLTVDSARGSSWRAEVRSLFLPGATSHGHYQIELKCDACHGAAFGGREALQEACVKCHGAELKAADDKHPKSKFTDPRNADRAALLDATQCVTCHVEHRPGITRFASVTLPDDYCAICHQDIGKDRPTHQGLTFTTCVSSGCHNFHDNRALYEDFLLKHAAEPGLLEQYALPERNFARVLEDLGSYPHDRYPVKPLGRNAIDAGSNLKAPALVVDDWLATAHAKAGVNCSACHREKDPAGEHAWVERPSHKVCTTCHEPEVKGFLAGKHGMRLAQDLEPMRPALARLPMKHDAGDKLLTCIACHGAHRFDTRTAAVEGCLACHDDTHSRAYKASPHYALWQRESKSELPAGSGVSCATCHMPRVSHRTPDDVTRILVQHNQNDTLRPNEKMIRSACLQCHGLQFSLDALADPRLIAANFKGHAAKRIESIDMAKRAEARTNESRRKAKDASAGG